MCGECGDKGGDEGDDEGGCGGGGGGDCCGVSGVYGGGQEKNQYKHI